VRPCILHSEQDTAKLARVLAAEIRFGDSVGLRGDLGAGKTTLVSWLVEALDGRCSHVCSPSYTLQNEYKLPYGRLVEHWDLYRLRELPAELNEPPGENTLRVIEWPEKVPGLMDHLSLIVELTASEAGDRKVRFDGALASKVERAVADEFLRG
jgi:tRNA threonylcarbamoyladenosine biosynthesis protein TsaE